MAEEGGKMKCILISTKPKYCLSISKGDKTIEIRKTKPKLETPFKCYIYCSKDSFKSIFQKKSYLSHNRKTYNGKVIGEFICDNVYEIDEPYLTWLEKSSCVNMEQISVYKGDKEIIYGWHISDLKVFDEPKEITEFKGWQETRFGVAHYPVKTAPQSWCYVEEL